MIWTPRIRFGGLLDIPDRAGETRSQGPVFGMGIDLKRPDSPEIDILNLKRSIVHGRLPQGENEILISESFAQKLGLHLGEQATLIGSTMNGSMGMHNFRVVGLIRFGVVALDKRTILADIRDVREALDMADGASEITGYSEDMIYTDTAMSLLAKEFNARYSNQDDEFSPVMMCLGEMEGMLKEILKMAGLIGGIIVMVFVFVMSIVLWNAGLMNGIRRYGEIGVRLAIGETKGGLYASMIVESLCIGLIGSAIGTTIGLILSYWLQVTGFDISSMMQKSTIMVSNVIRARVTPTSYVIGFLPGLFASVLGTMAAGIGIYRRQTSQLFRELET